jgi:hypothetical protein
MNGLCDGTGAWFSSVKVGIGMMMMALMMMADRPLYFASEKKDVSLNLRSSPNTSSQ